MNNAPIERLLWEGSATIEAALAALSRQVGVKLELPESYHHALRAHLQPEAASGQGNGISVHDGAELIARMAKVRGLEALNALAKAVDESAAEVSFESPLPRVLIRPRKDPAGPM